MVLYLLMCSNRLGPLVLVLQIIFRTIPIDKLRAELVELELELTSQTESYYELGEGFSSICKSICSAIAVSHHTDWDTNLARVDT